MSFLRGTVFTIPVMKQYFALLYFSTSETWGWFPFQTSTDWELLLWVWRNWWQRPSRLVVGKRLVLPPRTDDQWTGCTVRKPFPFQETINLYSLNRNFLPTTHFTRRIDWIFFDDLDLQKPQKGWWVEHEFVGYWIFNIFEKLPVLRIWDNFLTFEPSGIFTSPWTWSPSQLLLILFLSSIFNFLTFSWILHPPTCILRPSTLLEYRSCPQSPFFSK